MNMAVRLRGQALTTCMLVCFSATNVVTATKVAVARAIPAKDMALSVSPLTVLPGTSRSSCLRECVQRGCQGFNFGQQQCELLGEFLCNSTHTLTPRQDYRYYDVEIGEWVLAVDTYRQETDCLALNRCSPKCYIASGSTTALPTTTNRITTPPPPTTTLSPTTTQTSQLTTTTQSSTTTALQTIVTVPQTVTTALQTTITAPQTTTTESQTTTTAPQTSSNFSCSNDADCAPVPNTDCRGILFDVPEPYCKCVAGYSYDPATYSCVTNCPGGYGDTFLLTSGYHIFGYDDIAEYTDGRTREFCLEQCVNDPMCASIDYDIVEGCFLSSLTKYGHEADWYGPNSGFEYYQRNCA